MARLRMLKPSLCTSLTVAEWPIEVRYLWTLLWLYLDDEGRGEDQPKKIKGFCLPYDVNVTTSDVDRWLTLMCRPSPDDGIPALCRYEVDARQYLHAVKWRKHQKPQHATPSDLPPCPVDHSNPTLPPPSDVIPHEKLMSPHEEDGSATVGLSPGLGLGLGWDGLEKDSVTASGDRASSDVDKSSPNGRTGMGLDNPPPNSFDAFWVAYPRKVAKLAARASWDKALKRDATPEQLVTAAKRWRAYCAACNTEKDFIPHPSTWLNQGRYNDELVMPEPESELPEWAQW